MITKIQYDKAIATHSFAIIKIKEAIAWHEKRIKVFNLAKTQLEPDGNCCAVCGDNDHQAWECHHNPLSKNYSA